MIFVFKTNVSDNLTIQRLQPILDKLFTKAKWNFDLEDCDNILRIESKIDIAEITIKLLKEKGLNCEELLD